MTFRDIIGQRPGGSGEWHPHDASDISGDAVFLSVEADRIYSGTITGEEIIIAGGAEGVIRSEDYVAGSAGWAILGDGSAEFNDVTVRGKLYAFADDGAGITLDPDDSAGGWINNAPTITFTTDIGLRQRIEGLNAAIQIAIIDAIGTKAEYAFGRSHFTIQGDSGFDVLVLDFETLAEPTLTIQDGAGGSDLATIGHSGVQVVAGTAAAPAYSFTGDLDMGMFRAGVDTLAFSTGGTEALRISSGQNVHPGADNASSLGLSTHRWIDVWAVDGTINTSDADQKIDVADSDLGLDFIRRLRPVRYVRTGGTRPHYGITAQNLKEAIGDVDFAGYVDPAHNGDDGPLGVRYHELIAPLIAAVQELADRTETTRAH